MSEHLDVISAMSQDNSSSDLELTVMTKSERMIGTDADSDGDVIVEKLAMIVFKFTVSKH